MNDAWLKATLLTLTGVALLSLLTLPGAPGAGGEQPTPTPMPPLWSPAGNEVSLPPDKLEVSTPLAPLSVPELTGEVAAPPVTIGFAGIGQEPDGNSFIHSPPDTNAAAGPSSLVEVTNGHVAIYDKTGGLIAGGDSGAGAVDLETFCEVGDCFDPKVIYDQESQRFVAVALEGKEFSDSYLHVMVSTDSTPENLSTDWDKFRHVAGASITGNGWFDYPGLGVSPDAVVVSGNIFLDSNGDFDGTKIRVFDKAELYDGDATATFVDIDRDLPTGGFTVQPAHHFGPPAGTFYLMQAWNSTFLRVTVLTGVPASPVVNNAFISTADQGVCIPTAPQQGTTKLIDTVCRRLMNAVWRDGSLLGTLTGSDSTDVRAVTQWFEVETNGYPSASPTLRQHGTIDDLVKSTFMSSISMDGCGNIALSYSVSSTSTFPAVAYSSREADDPLGEMPGGGVEAFVSAFHFDDFTGLPGGSAERWGDYSSMSVDPADQSFWVANEYARVAATGAGDDGRWGTWLANFTFGCVPPPTPTVSPAPTITPTPTKQPDPGDTDGDGCSDQNENGLDETQGGLRNYKDPNDYYDVYGPFQSLTRDGVIDLPNDILGVILHFAPLGTEPEYDVRFDRGQIIGANHWERDVPDGVVDLPNDILGVILQFGHNCALRTPTPTPTFTPTLTHTPTLTPTFTPTPTTT